MANITNTTNSTNSPNKKYLCGWQPLGERYGVTARNAQRMVLDGRLPEPSYMPGSRSPLWELALLDEHDRCILTRSVRGRRPVASSGPEAA
jgi:hypothetical protein